MDLVGDDKFLLDGERRRPERVLKDGQEACWLSWLRAIRNGGWGRPGASRLVFANFLMVCLIKVVSCRMLSGLASVLTEDKIRSYGLLTKPVL